MANLVKVHLVPRAGGMQWSICGTRIREGGRQAVETRKAFNALPVEERCMRCNAVVNGKSIWVRVGPERLEDER